MSGYSKFPHGWLDTPAFGGRREPYCRRAAWAWLVENARWREGGCDINGKTVVLHKGQMSHSNRFLAREWNWDETKVRRFIARLVQDDMIACVTASGQHVITICNYEGFQLVATIGDAPPPQQQLTTASPPPQVRKIVDKIPEASLQEIASDDSADGLFIEYQLEPPKPQSDASRLFGNECLEAMAFFMGKDPRADSAAIRRGIGKLRKAAANDEALVNILLEQAQCPNRADKGYDWVIGCLKRTTTSTTRLAVNNAGSSPKTDEEAIDAWCRSVPGIMPADDLERRWGKWSNGKGVLDYWAAAVLEAAKLPAAGRGKREMDVMLDWMAAGYDVDCVVRAIEAQVRKASTPIISLRYFETTIARLPVAA